MILTVVSMDTGTFSARYVSTILEIAQQRGADRGALLALLSLSEDQLTLSAKRVPSMQVIDLLHAAMRLCHDPVLGLHVGDAFKPGTFDILGYAVMCAANLREAIMLNYRYQPLTQELGSTPLTIEDGEAVLEWRPRHPDAELMRPMTEAAMAGYAGIGRWITWRNKHPIKGMQFRHSAPEDYGEYERIFDCPLEFGAPRNAMLFDRHFLDTQLQQTDTTTVELLTRQLDKRLKKFINGDSIRAELSCFIQSRLNQGLPSIGDAARALGCGERTLRRRLERENTSYRDVLDSVRRESSRVYLLNTDISLSDISLLLGYKDQSAFTHAFRGWFKQSPRKYREGAIGEV